MDNHNRTIMITGARTGIGRGLAEYFLAEDWTVLGCSRRPADLGHQCYTHFELDVADEAAVADMFRQVRQTHQGLYALINNAGIAKMNPALLTPEKTFSQIFRTNVTGTFVCLREAAKIMGRQTRGRIINLSTTAVPLALAGEAAYAASKAAVENLTRTLASELAPMGITVNTLGPTPVKTELIRNVPPQTLDKLIARQVIPRFAELRDITNVLQFFLNPDSDFITAQTIYLGGISR